jgi:hypothetical protein
VSARGSLTGQVRTPIAAGQGISLRRCRVNTAPVIGGDVTHPPFPAPLRRVGGKISVSRAVEDQMSLAKGTDSLPRWVRRTTRGPKVRGTAAKPAGGLREHGVPVFRRYGLSRWSRAAAEVHDLASTRRGCRPARGQRSSWSRRASRRRTVPSTSASLSRPKSPMRNDEKSSPSPHMRGTPAAT